MKKRIFSILFSLVLVLSLSLVAAVRAMADGEAQTLQVSQWSDPATLSDVSGRTAVIKVGDTYHMWYSTDDNTLYHTSSTNPGSFAAGTLTTYDADPMERAS
ncbi:MAG: hypothetical protein GX144_10950, partial [Clostridiaceae bacterium]|nr:hypothetical protein [Clostridiaceae bacterium]